MALPKRKSRRIVVANNEYRYAVSISWKESGYFDFNITVQHDAYNSCKLLLKGLVTRDFWLDFSDRVGEEIDKNDYPTITPKHIKHFIVRATNEGWDFKSRGRDFILSVNNEDLTTF